MKNNKLEDARKSIKKRGLFVGILALVIIVIGVAAIVFFNIDDAVKSSVDEVAKNTSKVGIDNTVTNELPRAVSDYSSCVLGSIDYTETQCVAGGIIYFKPISQEEFQKIQKETADTLIKPLNENSFTSLRIGRNDDGIPTGLTAYSANINPDSEAIAYMTVVQNNGENGDFVEQFANVESVIAEESTVLEQVNSLFDIQTFVTDVYMSPLDLEAGAFTEYFGENPYTTYLSTDNIEAPNYFKVNILYSIESKYILIEENISKKNFEILLPIINQGCQELEIKEDCRKTNFDNSEVATSVYSQLDLMLRKFRVN